MQDKACCTTGHNPLHCWDLCVLRQSGLCYIRNTVFRGVFLKVFKDYLSLVSERSAFPEVSAPQSGTRLKQAGERTGRFIARMFYFGRSFFTFFFIFFSNDACKWGFAGGKSRKTFLPHVTPLRARGRGLRPPVRSAPGAPPFY